MPLNLCIIYASFMCWGPATIHQMSPLMSKHGNRALLLTHTRGETDQWTGVAGDLQSLSLPGIIQAGVWQRHGSLGMLHEMMQHTSKGWREKSPFPHLHNSCRDSCVVFEPPTPPFHPDSLLHTPLHAPPQMKQWIIHPVQTLSLWINRI